jgi:ferric-dicitrate binding protein FerR (iron transport regulator)
MRDEEEVTAELLRLAGARPDAPTDVASRVRTAVRGHWHATQRRRALRRGAALTSALVGVAAAAVLVVRSTLPRDAPRAPLEVIVATGERVEGAPFVHRQVQGTGRDLRLSLRTAVRADDVVVTDPVSRAALRSADGSSVRLDRNSHARLISSTVIELVDGAVYIATSESSKGFEVRTPLGTVIDVGTQFEVSVAKASLRVRVRTGRVGIRRGNDVIPTTAGMEATVTSSRVDMRTVPSFGSLWDWTTSLAPPFTIEGRSLDAFLEYLAREEGWTLRYATTQLADAAKTIVLHGSVEGLRAEEALDVVLATSGLRYRLRDHELLVSRAPAQ